jgi:diacylglycerol O-acyltransferase-1
LWNLPVHRWCVRHVYNPLLKKGFSREVAALFVFFFSAVGHEYIVSIPLGFVSCYAFLAIILQSPIQYFESYFNKILKIQDSQLGNVMFWITVCVVGEPICIGIYYYLYIMHKNQ